MRARQPCYPILAHAHFRGQPATSQLCRPAGHRDVLLPLLHIGPYGVVSNSPRVREPSSGCLLVSDSQYPKVCRRSRDERSSWSQITGIWTRRRPEQDRQSPHDPHIVRRPLTHAPVLLIQDVFRLPRRGAAEAHGGKGGSDAA